MALIDETVGGGSPERIHSRFRQINSKAAYVLLADEPFQRLARYAPKCWCACHERHSGVLLTVSRIVLK